MQNSSRDAHLQYCQQQTLDFSSEYFTQFHAQVDNGFFKLAEKAETNQQQQLYFESRESFLKQKGLEEQFIAHIKNSFECFQQNKITISEQLLHTTEKQDGTLSLVKNDELEESLAISGMINKQETMLSEAIYSLNQRLALINGGQKIEPMHSPVEPAVFVNALCQCIKNLDFNTDIKLLIYKWFDKYLVRKVHKLYQSLNSYFREKGVLPNLIYRHINKSAEPSGKTDKEHNEQAAETQASILTNQQTHQELLEKILALQSSQRQIPNKPQWEACVLSHKEIGHVLGDIQLQQAQRLNDAQNNNTTLPLAEPTIIERSLQAHGKDKNLHHLDEEVIELVGLIFKYMLSDAKLTDKAKALLSYLHTPFLKIAMLEKEFFSSPEHPAQQLLNLLVEAGSRWQQDESKNTSVYKQMHSVIQTILNKENCDSATYAELAFDFSAFLREHKRRIKRTEERTTQVTQGENKLLEIQQKVERLLLKKTKHLRLPQPIKCLLFEPWASYMQFIILRHGAKSNDMQQALLTVDDIVNYIMPSQNRIAQQRAQSMSKDLLQRIQAGFDTIGFNQAKGQELIKALSLCQQLSQGELLADKDEIAKIEQQLQQKEAELAGHLKTYEAKLKQLEFNSWFIFKDKNSKETAKLAWYNERTNHYMFVNKMGQQTRLCTAQELAELLSKKQLEALKDDFNRPFIEKAFEAVINKLQNKR